MSTVSELVTANLWAMEACSFEALCGALDAPQALLARPGAALPGSGSSSIRDGVAVIPLVGPITPRGGGLLSFLFGGRSAEDVARDFTAALENPEVRAIVLDVDSPGGVVTGVNELANMIASARGQKPIVSFVGGAAASAAYWIAAAADEIVIDATARLGSIGVVMAAFRRSDKFVVEIVSRQSPLKRPDPDTDAGRAEMQQQADAIADVFVASVARFRGTDTATVLRDFGAGGIRIGEAAIAAGMADRDGALEETIALLAGDSRTTTRRMMGMANDKTVTLRDGEQVIAASELEALKAAATQADKAGYDRGLAEGLEKGREAGATAERERILGIEDQAGLPGCEDLVAELKRDGKTSPADAALKINAAFRAKPAQEQEAALEALRKQDQPVDPAPTPTGDVPPAPAAGPIDEVTARRMWDQNIKHPKTGNRVRDEFVSFQDFLGFAKHEHNVRILDKRAS